MSVRNALLFNSQHTTLFIKC